MHLISLSCYSGKHQNVRQFIMCYEPVCHNALLLAATMNTCTTSHNVVRPNFCLGILGNSCNYVLEHLRKQV